MDALQNLKKLAGIKESGASYELHQYNIGNSRPFVMEGNSNRILAELQDRLDKGDFEKLEIVPTRRRA